MIGGAKDRSQRRLWPSVFPRVYRTDVPFSALSRAVALSWFLSVSSSFPRRNLAFRYRQPPSPTGWQSSDPIPFPLIAPSELPHLHTTPISATVETLSIPKNE